LHTLEITENYFHNNYTLWEITENYF